MPTPIISISASSSNQVVTLIDETVYSGGPGARPNFGNIALVYKATSKGDIVKRMTPDVADIKASSSYTLTIRDAVYLKIVFVIYRIWSVGTTYGLNDIVASDISNSFYISLQNGNTGNTLNNPAFWRILDLSNTNDLRLLAYFLGTTLIPGNNSDSSESEIAVYPNIAKYENNLIQAQAICSCFNGCVIENYEKIRLLYEGIVHGTDNDERQEMYEYLLELTKR